MEYKTITGVDYYYSYPNQQIAVKVDAKIERELTKEEEYYFLEACQKLAKMLRKNTILTDEQEIFHVKEERRQLLECFPQPIYVKEIPNEYEGPDCTRSWFLVTTPKGPIKIGWRNRVINIDWTDSDIKSDANWLFVAEDTTKMGCSIHAWGYDKCREYLNKLLT